MDTEVDVPNPELVLVPGMYAEVDLTLAQRNAVLAVPVMAVDADNGGSSTAACSGTVMVVTPNNRVELRKIQSGLQTANQVEVKSGLNEGDLVVIGGRSALQAGVEVKPKVTVMAESKQNRRPELPQHVKFAIRNPYFIVVVCLIIAVVGVTSLARMPVDMFPAMNIPVVVVATFTRVCRPSRSKPISRAASSASSLWAAGIEHIESRSLPGVSVIKVYFQPGTNPDSAVTTISNLAMAQLRRLPPGTLPPVVLKFDASSLPVCLVLLKAKV